MWLTMDLTSQATYGRGVLLKLMTPTKWSIWIDIIIILSQELNKLPLGSWQSTILNQIDDLANTQSRWKDVKSGGLIYCICLVVESHFKMVAMVKSSCGPRINKILVHPSFMRKPIYEGDAMFPVLSLLCTLKLIPDQTQLFRLPRLTMHDSHGNWPRDY